MHHTFRFSYSHLHTHIYLSFYTILLTYIEKDGINEICNYIFIYLYPIVIIACLDQYNINKI